MITEQARAKTPKLNNVIALPGLVGKEDNQRRLRVRGYFTVRPRRKPHNVINPVITY